VDRALIRWICIIAAIILAFAWLLSALATGFAAPSWVAPASVVALCAAIAIP
jgi:hypothetical protein